MGTRSLTHIKSEGLESETLVTIYRQYDGYPEGLGKQYFEMLSSSTLVNGYLIGQENPHYFNGMGCLAAYLISKLKYQIGNVYIYPRDSRDCNDEYIYTIYAKESRIAMRIEDSFNAMVLFDGYISEFGEWLVNNSSQ
jgi:hypothetical protein